MEYPFTLGGSNPFDPKAPALIYLQPTAGGTFTVGYGLQVRKNLTYASAAHMLGENILHYLRCEGMLDSEPEPKTTLNRDAVWPFR